MIGDGEQDLGAGDGWGAVSASGDWSFPEDVFGVGPMGWGRLVAVGDAVMVWAAPPWPVAGLVANGLEGSNGCSERECGESCEGGEEGAAGLHIRGGG